MPKLTIVTEAMMRAQTTPPKFGVLCIMLSFEPLRQSLDVLVKGGRIGTSLMFFVLCLALNGALMRKACECACFSCTFFVTATALMRKTCECSLYYA